MDRIGTYFKDIYDNITSQLSTFPTNDPSPNLKECITNANFIRAIILARQHNLSSDLINNLQELALFQYWHDYKNYEELVNLSTEFNLTQQNRIRIMELFLKEQQYPCFSYSKNTECTIDENWVRCWSSKTIPMHIEKLSWFVKMFNKIKTKDFIRGKRNRIF